MIKSTHVRFRSLLLGTSKNQFLHFNNAEMHQICTLRTLRNPLRPLRLNPNYFNRKGRKDYAKDTKNLFLEVPSIDMNISPQLVGLLPLKPNDTKQ